MEWVTEQAGLCTECEICMDVCPDYQVTGEPLFSPMYRLKTASRLFSGKDPDPRMVESMYNCPKCMLCDRVCPEEIQITKVVHETRKELVRRGFGPLAKHEKIIEQILTTGNSVNGDPAKRLDWLPEQFPKNESDTLLYLGCLPSYLVKDSATATYLVLKKLGVDFMILKDEGCCGTYIYEAGKQDLAAEFFQKNMERFRSLGIKKMIVPCNGCLKCFKYFYPDVLGKIDITVYHAEEIIYDELKKDPSRLRKIPRRITYQDSCRMARGEGITEEPRQLLEWCGAEILEPEVNRADTPCCGAGAGIRSVFRELSTDIAQRFLEKAPAEFVVSTCPFCTFNLGYTSKKKQLGKKLTYFTSLVLESLE
ncbi:MAG: (Fe-S)-binding protein [Thermodesulfobacteriota bacterium]|nr:(Fe-S)-binding protein [Thermodesulfobacteriota bacterium]